MTVLRWRGVAAGALALAAAQSVDAQTALSGNVEVLTDERRRGISWSEGAAAIAGEARADVGAINAGLRLVTLRRSPRSSGADGVADADIGTGWDLGPVRARVRGTVHLFLGAAERADYGEIGGDLSYSLGPAQVAIGASYAPDQAAIGGDNLYMFVTGNVGIPGTGLTVTGAAGRSSGTADDPRRAARLRPGGRYADWQLGIEHVAGPLTLGLDYLGTDIRRSDIRFPMADAGHSGDAVIGRARLSF